MAIRDKLFDPGRLIEDPDSAGLLGAVVVRLQFPAIEGPAAFRYPVAAFKINFIQRHVANVAGRLTTYLVIPEVGGATKLPAPSLPQNLLVIAVSRLNGTCVEIIALFGRFVSSGFQEADAESATGDLTRENDTGWTAANNTDIERQKFAGHPPKGID
jgi:hypothetical protein